ncbi:MAG: hypothetical protein KBF93_18360 [Leptospiraceae bacterium]|nr:hypothetical protein [Leptospiraceae bacterium]
MKSNWNLVLVVLVFPLAFSVFADTFLLKDGKTIVGTQVEKTDKVIIYKDEAGVTKRISLDRIEKVTLDKKADEGESDKKSAKDDSKYEELMAKVAELTSKVEELSAKNKENNDSGKSNGEKTSSTVSSGSNKPNVKEDESEASVEVTAEVVSDFIWRGNSYGGEYLSRRNNSPYTGVNQYWAFQPNLRINSPVSGLYMEFWGNFSLNNRADRDSDMRLFQASPGGLPIDPYVYFGKLDSYKADPSAGPIDLLYDPANNLVNSKCEADGCTNPETSFVDPRKVGKRREKNGMARTDGAFTTFAYNFQNKKFGDITWGVWFYYQFDKNAKYSWDEYFIFWGLPFLQNVIKPTVSFYTQSSFDFDSIYAGGHYLSFTVSHTFFEGKFFRVQPMSNLGYKYQNNNIDQKSGFYDLTTNLKFFFGDFFFSLNHAFRPDVHMYDSDSWYYPISQGSPSQVNRNSYDGKIVDPSKLYGYKNELVYSAIDQLEAPDIIKNYVKEEYQSQKVVQHLFYISFGYNFKF